MNRFLAPPPDPRNGSGRPNRPPAHSGLCERERYLIALVSNPGVWFMMTGFGSLEDTAADAVWMRRKGVEAVVRPGADDTRDIWLRWNHGTDSLPQPARHDRDGTGRERE